MTGAEIVFGYSLPQADGTYLGEIPRVVSPEEIAAMDRSGAAVEITRRVTEFYEEAIRAHPECWLWSYKRWRHVPPGASAEGFPSYAKPTQGDRP